MKRRYGRYGYGEEERFEVGSIDLERIDKLLTSEEKRVLKQIYRFQKPRRFRFGLNIHYLDARDPEKVVEKLKSLGLIFTIAPYRDKQRYVYAFLTKLGRTYVEERLLSEKNVT